MDVGLFGGRGVLDIDWQFDSSMIVVFGAVLCDFSISLSVEIL